MRRVALVLLIVLCSAAYWVGAAVVIVIAAYVIPGDCGTARDAADLQQCQDEVGNVLVVSVAIAVMVFGAGIWRIIRRP